MVWSRDQTFVRRPFRTLGWVPSCDQTRRLADAETVTENLTGLAFFRPSDHLIGGYSSHHSSPCRHGRGVLRSLSRDRLGFRAIRIRRPLRGVAYRQRNSGGAVEAKITLSRANNVLFNWSA